MKRESNNIQDYPDAALLFPSRYVKAAEIALAKKPVPLTIARIEPRHELKSTNGKTESKPCMFFKETPKGVVLNRTNCNRLVEVLGKDPRKWIGARVVFCVERVDGFGKKTDAIRVDTEQTIAHNRGQRATEPEPQSWDDLQQPEPDEAELARQAADAEQR